MDETVIFPSPNWFQVSVLKVSRDGWLVYGAPIRGLCVLKPLDKTIDGVLHSKQGYQAYVARKVHPDKIVSIDLSPDWPEKKLVLTGSSDGLVKQWIIEEDNQVKIKSTHNLNIHHAEKEAVIGVGYSSEPFAVTVGTFGSVVKWDLKSNIAKNYNNFLKSFKPTCLACSHIIPLNVAVGTKQGVVIVLDLNNTGKIIYKIRSQDDEIVNMSWCPQYRVEVRKSLEIPKKSLASERLEKIRSSGENELPETSHNNSAIDKNLPQDSFDGSDVETDLFDVYTDHAAVEFGHTKYEPRNIIVKVKEKKEDLDFLEECKEIKQAILEMKNTPEPSIQELVDALEKTSVDNGNSDEDNSEEPICAQTSQSNDSLDSTIHTHRHLLATLGKHGGVKVWSKTGKLVSNCIVPNTLVNKNQKNWKPMSNSSTLLWYKPDVLLIADGKSQLLEINPLKIDGKNKTVWSVVHNLHKRGFYCIASNAPQLKFKYETFENLSDQSQNWLIWTIAQDRNLICYSYERKETVGIYNTCGGFIYELKPCPYDAKRIAMCVGDGAVRVWETDVAGDDDNPKLSLGNVKTFWQNVQGKVLTVHWHPTQENLLAFATGESRIGLIDVSKPDRAAKTLPASLRGGIYSICWGEDNNLYACGGGNIVMYQTDKPEANALPIKVEFEGRKWDISSVSWYPAGMLVGSGVGAVAVLHPATYELLSVAYVFDKMIHYMDWHPNQTSNSSEESPYKNLIAVSSNQRQSFISILEYTDKGEGPKLHPWNVLTGHEAAIFAVTWNPHKDGILMSCSQDNTVRIWDVPTGTCISLYGGHDAGVFTACWSLQPLAHVALSGGADCCLRAWDPRAHPPALHSEIKHEAAPKKKKKAKKDETKEEKPQEVEVNTEDRQIATTVDVHARVKVPKRFLLPTIQRQILPCTIQSVRRMACKYLGPHSAEESFGDVKSFDPDEQDSDKSDTDCEREVEGNFDFTKIFGSTNDLNEVLDIEMRRHKANARLDSSLMLSMFRGRVAEMVQDACDHDALCPFLVSLAPCVSFKYWKEVMQLYIAQSDRLVAQKKYSNIFDIKHYGGHVYRKVALLLSQHDIVGAVNVLAEMKLHKEAYILARSRHMDSIAEGSLKEWASHSVILGYKNLAAVCFLALGDVNSAAMTLGKSHDQEALSLAAMLAKHAGQPTYANHIEDKILQIQNETPETEDLKPLPSKVDAVLKHNEKTNEIVSNTTDE